MTRDKFLKRRRELLKLCKAVQRGGRYLNVPPNQRKMIRDFKREGLMYWTATTGKMPANRQGAFFSMFTMKLDRGAITWDSRAMASQQPQGDASWPRNHRRK